MAKMRVSIVALTDVPADGVHIALDGENLGTFGNIGAGFIEVAGKFGVALTHVGNAGWRSRCHDAQAEAHRLREANEQLRTADAGEAERLREELAKAKGALEAERDAKRGWRALYETAGKHIASLEAELAPYKAVVEALTTDDTGPFNGTDWLRDFANTGCVAHGPYAATMSAVADALDALAARQAGEPEQAPEATVPEGRKVFQIKARAGGDVLTDDAGRVWVLGERDFPDWGGVPRNRRVYLHDAPAEPAARVIAPACAMPACPDPAASTGLCGFHSTLRNDLNAAVAAAAEGAK